jgi:hypothetical protein
MPVCPESVSPNLANHMLPKDGVIDKMFLDLSSLTLVITWAVQLFINFEEDNLQS